MHVPRPDALKAADWRAALGFVNDVASALGEDDGYVHSSCQGLQRLVASELTTLSICHLVSGRRTVHGDSAGSIGPAERECFDRHFSEHPLVLVHGVHKHAHVHRISDSMSSQAFQGSPLYADYYRRIGIDCVLAMPIYQSDGWLVSWVLNRRGRDFSERDAALLDQVRAPLARFFRSTDWMSRLAPSTHGAAQVPVLSARAPLTAREREVLQWVAAGKTDRDVAAIVGMSVRTVHKHLQHVYAKLGVETRTAAVMRALG
ncbi:MAG TPA: LuxR C-terminal-related transcriptional regulator [Burkholderiaceae bacterium]|nr:LuxR C-terminal-related transcriptional regulator [Burkholderiaceae bacterium]